MTNPLLVIALSALFFVASCTSPKPVVVYEIPAQNQSLAQPSDNEYTYLGQTPTPGDTPLEFAHGLVTNDIMNHSIPVFSPDGKEVFWSQFVIKNGWLGTIYTSRFIDGQWTEREAATFHNSTDGEDNPSYSPDGKRLYFTSRREMPHDDPEGAENIWFVERTDDGWSEAKPITKFINDRELHWRAMVNAKNDLFYSHGALGTLVSRYVDGEYTEPKRLHEEFGSGYEGSLTYVDTDETLMLFCKNEHEDNYGNVDIYAGFKLADGTWSTPVNLGLKINGYGASTYPGLTPDGKYLFFLRPVNGEFNVFWVDATFIKELRKQVVGNDN